MAHLAYLKLAGIKGPAVIKHPTREDHIGLFAVTHDVGSPPGAEKATERLHHPIYVTKNIDFTSPKLHQHLVEGTEIADGWINFFHMPRSNDENNYYSIVLTGIRIVSIRSVMPSTQTNETADIHEYEEVGLMYKGISWVGQAPRDASLETGTFAKAQTDEPEAKFGPDWIEDEAEARATEILNKIKEELTTRLKAEAKKKLDEQNAPKK